MFIGFVKLIDLHAMFREMNQRFFERNIRSGLTGEEAPNRAITQSLKQIILGKLEDPSVFAFNHNGVTLFAEKFDRLNDHFLITEPRLLNGAQTLTTFDRFIKHNEGDHKLTDKVLLESLTVLCKIITRAKPEFIVTVTINNNRQNPVMPWNLRANDEIQLELQDKFRDDLGIYYERQENAFSNLTNADLEDMEIAPGKALELFRLARLF
ncbi:MAG TPA: AIPR family protein [Nitrospiraceae bacterium]|nr:AIPR family protein [Nitrospiraceae bacterium]